jgi:hypothetical protein
VEKDNISNCTNLTPPNNSSYQLDWSDYLYIFACLLGLFTLSINIKIFLNSQLTDHIYKYVLAESFVDLFYLGLLSAAPLFYIDSIKSAYLTQLYILVIFNYLTSCMAINNILIQLFISIQRLSIILNSSFLKKNSFK